MTDVKIERTGRIFSIASTEYLVTFPDGYKRTIWSPPWHELDDEEEDAKALEFAINLWKTNTYKKEEPCT